MSTTIADYSNNPAIPTLINLVVDRNNKNIFNALLANNVGGSDTKDYLTFTVPFDQTLTSFKLSSYSSTDGKAFIALQTGNSVTATETNPSPLRGYTHFGPSVQGATVDSNLINLLGGPLGPGTYSVWIQQLGALTDYTFELQTTYNKPIVWTRLLGTTSTDQAAALTTGVDGAIYVAGYTEGNLDGQIRSGSQDAFITRYNTDGTKAWTRLLGTTALDRATALTTGTDGAIYVAGYTGGNLDGQVNKATGTQDAFITRYNTDGTKAWTRLLGTTSTDQATAVTTGTDGAIYVSGYTEGNLDGQINSGSDDAFITRYNTDGTKAWTRLLGTTSDDQARALTTGADGAIYVAGYTYGNLDGQVNNGYIDAFITKYNPDGTKAWTRLLGTTSRDGAYALTTGTGGAIYVAGYTYGNLDGQIKSGYYEDAFITKYNTDGTKAWTRLLGTTSEDYANALTTGVDGAIYVAGYTGGNLDGQIKSGSDDAFITKYNTDGTKAWTRLFGSTKALTTGADGAIYVAGYTSGNLDGQIKSGYYEDAFISKWNVEIETSYNLQSTTSIVNEGSTAIFNLTTTNVASGTSLTYTISGVTAADITGGNLTGSVNVGTDGNATISIPIAADNTTEGDETLTLTIQGKSASILIKDLIQPTGIFLPVDSHIALGSSQINVYGGSGAESVVVGAASSQLVLDQNIERLYLSEAPSAYRFQQSGIRLDVYKASGSELVVSAALQTDADGTVLVFSGGAASATVSAAGMRLGGALVTQNAITTLAPQLSAATLAPTSQSSAGVFLAPNANFVAASSGIKIFGTSGSETVSLSRGVSSVDLDQAVERVQFDDSPISALRFLQQGISLLVYDATMLLASVPLQNDLDGTLITTNEGTMQAKVSAAGMRLGGSLVSPVTPSSVVPLQIDTTAKGGRISAPITSTGTFNAATGDVTFSLASVTSSYNYTIAGFGAGDKIVGPSGVTPTITDQGSFTDGSLSVQYVSGGNVVKITLTGLTAAQDSAIFGAPFLNSVFGEGTIT